MLWSRSKSGVVDNTRGTPSKSPATKVPASNYGNKELKGKNSDSNLHTGDDLDPEIANFDRRSFSLERSVTVGAASTSYDSREPDAGSFCSRFCGSCSSMYSRYGLAVVKGFVLSRQLTHCLSSKQILRGGEGGARVDKIPE